MAQKRAKKRTELAVDRLSHKPRPYVRLVEGRLYIRVTPSSKIWAYCYTMPGGKKRQWLSLGQYTQHNDITAARAKAAEHDAMIEGGIDPANPPPPPEEEHEPTLQDVFDTFIKKGLDRKGSAMRESTIKGYEQAFNADILPHLGQRKVCELRRRDILPVLELIVERGSSNQANQVYRRLRRVLEFAAEREVIDVNPMASMQPFGETNSRARVLADAEIKVFLEWKPRSDQARRILRLILITGARPGEVAGMCWGEIADDWWTIPAERTKTKSPHRVYLTALAKSLLPERKLKGGKMEPAAGPVFTISRLSVSQCLHRAIESPAEVPEKKIRGGQPSPLHVPAFVPHDLRRTMATGLASMGFSDEAINAVQGRAKRGIIAVYNRHEYEKERQAAAEAWERKLRAILAGVATNVIPIAKGRGGKR